MALKVEPRKVALQEQPTFSSQTVLVYKFENTDVSMRGTYFFIIELATLLEKVLKLQVLIHTLFQRTDLLQQT